MGAIDICIPYEDYEYNIVGNYRAFFAFFELISLISLTLLSFWLPTSPTKLYIQSSIFSIWPIIPFRDAKIILTLLAPFESAQSYLLCLLIRTETTLQYSFSLSHLLCSCLFVSRILSHRRTNFEVTEKYRKSHFVIPIVSLIISVLFVNLISFTSIFAIIYSAIFVISFLYYFAIQITALAACSVRRKLYKKGAQTKDGYRYSWLIILCLPITTAHGYQTMVIDTFLIPVFFPQFSGSYYNTFRYVTGVVSIRFLVSTLLATAPMFLIPPVRRIYFPSLDIFKKLKKDRVVRQEVAPSDKIIGISIIS